MTLDLAVGALVLVGAFLHAGWNAMVKAGDDRLIALAAVFLSSGIAGLLAVPFVPVPAAAAWPWLALSIVIHIFYVAGLVGAYSHGDLSRVYPIARGCGPLLVALVAGRLVGEHLTLVQAAGLVLVSVGIVGLALEPGSFGVGRRGTLWALFTGATIAGYTVSDGMGARLSGDALGYTAWLFAAQIPVIPVYAWLSRPEAVRAYLASGAWKRGAGGGMVALASYGIAIWAMSVAPMALVAALRETSVLFAALIGTLLLGEGMGRWRIAAALLVVAGQILMNIGPG
ncbi:EamA family transporter [Stella sp.]|uniref:EamA family transporter n=1 Tax=Stella sp. TaxID=2912054 RepID=UPI0035ADB4A2